ncbi:YycH family regulatory protein [Paenibacillus thermotolerans]|uniref:YycH family regulatory protein n=1 Tax=Paenibacillus thermotolerans TaxID=3027807 RepID=UPI0023681616|nr:MULTISPECIES: two-component system activity regulator YycH [unclassified Paenibacillus]
MNENVKTVILTVLVAASLVQSYLLAYSSPKFDAIIPNDYVESKLQGTQAELSQLLFPSDIVLHFGEDQHTVLYPNMTFYRMILDVVKQRAFDGIREVGAIPELAEQSPRNTLGLEIRFPSDMPLSLLEQFMHLKGDGLEDSKPIERIWIFTRADREEVRVFFIGSGNRTVYEATKADLTVKDVERFVGFGKARGKYQLIGGSHYLPMEPLQMIQYEMHYTSFTAEQLQRSLFPDPATTRFLRERNGSEIYTDGKRGLQLSNDQHWLSYSDPAAPVEGTYDELGTSLSAVQFINRHGGWNGSYLLSSIQQESGVSQEQTVVFRQYIGNYPGSFPIVSPGEQLPYGTIRLTLQNGVVTAYERSMIQLEETSENRELVQLRGGESLVKALQGYSKFASVKQLIPAYRLVLDEEYEKAILKPVWAVLLSDGTVEALPGGAM